MGIRVVVRVGIRDMDKGLSSVLEVIERLGEDTLIGKSIELQSGVGYLGNPIDPLLCTHRPTHPITIP